MKVDLLVNYGWEWDLAGLKSDGLRSGQVSRMDLIVRWGGGRRLSGFPMLQSVYADFYGREEYWPDCDPQHFDHAIAWFKTHDKTLGGWQQRFRSPRMCDLPNSLLIAASMASWGHSAVSHTLQRGVPREPTPLLGFKLDEKRRPSEV